MSSPEQNYFSHFAMRYPVINKSSCTLPKYPLQITLFNTIWFIMADPVIRRISIWNVFWTFVMRLKTLDPLWFKITWFTSVNLFTNIHFWFIKFKIGNLFMSWWVCVCKMFLCFKVFLEVSTVFSFKITGITLVNPISTNWIQNGLRIFWKKGRNGLEISKKTIICKLTEAAHFLYLYFS